MKARIRNVRIRNRGLGSAGVVMMTLLAGCATLEGAAPGDGPGDLLAFYHHADALEPEGMASAYHRFRNWVREDQCAPDRIRLDAIEQVSATDGTKGLTRPRLVIIYTDGGTTRKRRVNLPSLYTNGGETVYEQAQEAFTERGF